MTSLSKKLYRAFALLLMLVWYAQPVHAYKDKSGFQGEDPVNYYTGSPRYPETCAESGCHETVSSGRLDVTIEGMERVASSPPFYYFDPAGKFKITVGIVPPDNNGAAPFNEDQNGFTLEILDQSNQPVGTFEQDSSYSVEFVDSGTVVIDEDDPTSIAGEWSFYWTAPASVSGNYTLYVAGIDGNGDGLANVSDVTDFGTISLVKQDLSQTSSGGGCGLVFYKKDSIEFPSVEYYSSDSGSDYLNSFAVLSGLLILLFGCLFLFAPNNRSSIH